MIGENLQSLSLSGVYLKTKSSWFKYFVKTVLNAAPWAAVAHTLVRPHEGSLKLTSFVCLLGLRQQRLLEVLARHVGHCVVSRAGSGCSAVDRRRGNSGGLCVYISSGKLESKDRRERRLVHACSLFL